MEIISNSDLSFVRNINRFVRSNQFTLTYSGSFSHLLTKSILSLTEKKIGTDPMEAATKKKVFSIMVECMQSVCQPDKATKNAAIFLIGQSAEGYTIISGNKIKQSEVEDLKKHLNVINEQDKDNLKKLYTDALTQKQKNSLGEAGLSLIDIAKKSGNKLEYEFSQGEESDMSFFSLKSIVKRA